MDNLIKLMGLELLCLEWVGGQTTFCSAFCLGPRHPHATPTDSFITVSKLPPSPAFTPVRVKLLSLEPL